MAWAAWWAVSDPLNLSGAQMIFIAPECNVRDMASDIHHPATCDDNDVAMMRLALALARDAAAMDEVPVGAVVYRGSEVLGRGHNRRESQADPTAHAEMIALREAAHACGSWRLDDCSIAVTLEPCPMCAGALVNARMARLVYGPDDPKMGSVRSLHALCTDTRFNHGLIVVPGILAEEGAQLLRDFFRKRRTEMKGGRSTKGCDDTQT